MESNMNSRLRNVLDRISSAVSKLEINPPPGLPRLVCVSKTKPVEAVIEAYSYGQRTFGENYIQELVAKSATPKLLSDCPEIKWHFIGNLQSNKIAQLVKVPNLAAVETVYSTSLAQKLDTAWLKQRQPSSNNEDELGKLRVFIQVKTSEDEDTKSGCAITDVPAIANFIRDNCKNLELAGLMTIGSAENSEKCIETKFNPDFAALSLCRKSLCESWGQNENHLELSMGMSTDFEVAIMQGSTNVRVGSLIFGSR